MEAVAILVAGLLIREGLMNTAATLGRIIAMLRVVEASQKDQSRDLP